MISVYLVKKCMRDVASWLTGMVDGQLNTTLCCYCVVTLGIATNIWVINIFYPKPLWQESLGSSFSSSF